MCFILNTWQVIQISWTTEYRGNESASGSPEWFSLKAPAGFIQIQNSRSGEEEINKTFVSESRWLWQSTDLNCEDSQIRRILSRSEAGEEPPEWLLPVNFCFSFNYYCTFSEVLSIIESVTPTAASQSLKHVFTLLVEYVGKGLISFGFITIYLGLSIYLLRIMTYTMRYWWNIGVQECLSTLEWISNILFWHRLHTLSFFNQLCNVHTD